jgi:hypothetical protein
VQALATVVLVALTATYALLTRRLAILADRQGKIAQRTAEAQKVLTVVGFLQAEYVRDARTTIRALKPSENWKAEWTTDQKKAAGIVSSTFDVIAMLVLNDLLDEEPFTTNWADALTTCFTVCEPYIHAMRADGAGPSYWGSYEKLALIASEKVDLPH